MFDAPSPRARVRLLDRAAALPELSINQGNLPDTARRACSLLALDGRYFSYAERLVRLALGDGQRPPTITTMNQHHVVNSIHEVCRPVRARADGEKREETFPVAAAHLLLSMAADHLSEFRGFCSTPKLLPGGGIEARRGYDPDTGLYFHNIPALNVPARPSREDAEAALSRLRYLFRTFCFGDAVRDADGWVEQGQPPGNDESAALVALLSAVSRPFIDRAPGTLVTAPSLNGSGAGKGLLVSVICMIAYGACPKVINASSKGDEFDKRIGAALMQATPALVIDNVNCLVPPSNLLASVLTEAQVQDRVLGESRHVTLLSNVAIFITGNGTTLQEDTLRRFCTVRLDPKVEDAEAREFPGGNLLAEVELLRGEYLTAAVTILCWARQNANAIKRGLPLGSFERWCAECRDPILALGGVDPVVRAREDKASDPLRREWAETFRLWLAKHGTTPVAIKELHPEVWARLAPPPRNNPQYARRRLEQMLNTQIGGLVLRRQKTAKHSDARYSVHIVDAGAAPLSEVEGPPSPAEARRRRFAEMERRAGQKGEGDRR